MSERKENTVKTVGPWRDTWRRYRSYKLGTLGLAMAVVLFVVAFLAPSLANDEPLVCRFDSKIYFPATVETIQNLPFAASFIEKSRPFRFESFYFKDAYDPDRGDWALWTPVPFGPNEMAASPLMPPDRAHWLGTDESGRDVLSRLIHGANVSIKVGFISMGIAALLGILLGAAAGYAGGWTDLIISRIIEVVMCFPVFFIILAVLAWLPPRIEYVMVVIGLVRWVGIARYTRAEVMKLRESDFALAARALGAGPFRILFRHLVPNAMAPILVSITFGFATAVLIEAGLSWLGFGVQPPDPSWGTLLRSGYENLLTAPHLIPPACVAIFLAVLSFNLIGDTLRDVIDPRLRSGGDS
jgi:peptide/nickel transport system permease protein